MIITIAIVFWVLIPLFLIIFKKKQVLEKIKETISGNTYKYAGEIQINYTDLALIFFSVIVFHTLFCLLWVFSIPASLLYIGFIKLVNLLAEKE